MNYESLKRFFFLWVPLIVACLGFSALLALLGEPGAVWLWRDILGVIR